MKKTLLIWAITVSLTILLLLVAGCSKEIPTYTCPDGSVVDVSASCPQSKGLNLCNDIQTPTVSINCEKENFYENGYQIGCYLTVSGDSRVSYRFYGYGSWGVLGGETDAGVRKKVSAGDRVEIIPYDKSTYTKCKNDLLPRLKSGVSI